MSDQFTSYQPPGVYTTEGASVIPTQVGVTPAVIAIIGPSIGYRTHTEAITLNGEDYILLGKQGINSGSLTVTKSNGVAAVVGDDYNTHIGSGETPEQDTASIRRASGSTIGDGETVVVSYRYTDLAYYEPLRVTGNDQVAAAFGAPLDRSTGEIISPLSFAAKFAFDNGASRLVLVAVEGTASEVTESALEAGYSKIQSATDVTVVVPLPVGISGSDSVPAGIPSLCSSFVASLDLAQSDGIRRIGVLGLEKSATISPVTVASECVSARVVLVHPNRMNYYNAYLSQTVEVSGYYHAAAWAGRLASLPVQYPMTRKQIRGFAGIPGEVISGMTKPVKDSWSKNGVAVTEVSVQKGLVSRHGVSTDPTSLFSREISLTRAKDAMLNAIIANLESADLIGSPIVEETPIFLRAQIVGSLETMVAQDVIMGYNSVSVQQMSIDPSVMEVRFQYRPSYPLNYISIVFSVDVNTGGVAQVVVDDGGD